MVLILVVNSEIGVLFSVWRISFILIRIRQSKMKRNQTDPEQCALYFVKFHTVYKIQIRHNIKDTQYTMSTVCLPCIQRLLEEENLEVARMLHQPLHEISHLHYHT